MNEERETVIVTRHAGAVAWLAEQGVTGEVIAHVTAPAQITGKVVIGALPLHLAALAAKVGSIDLPNLPAEQRGRDLEYRPRIERRRKPFSHRVQAL